MSDTDKFFEEACQYYIEHRPQLLKICMKAAQNDIDKAEELMSDVVLRRLPRILQLWDRSRSQYNYVIRSVRWYVFKELTRNRKLSNRYVNNLKDAEIERGYVLNTIDELEHLLNGLTKFEQQVILLYIAHGYTYKEIGDWCGMPRARVSEIVNDAISKLRRSADTGQGGQI